MEEIKIIIASHKKYQKPVENIYLPVQVGAEGKEKIEWYNVLKNWFKSNLYLVLLSYSYVFIIFYLIYYFNNDLKIVLKYYVDIIEFFKTLSILSFTAGVFTVTLKYFQYLLLEICIFLIFP